MIITFSGTIWMMMIIRMKALRPRNCIRPIATEASRATVDAISTVEVVMMTLLRTALQKCERSSAAEKLDRVKLWNGGPERHRGRHGRHGHALLDPSIW